MSRRSFDQLRVSASSWLRTHQPPVLDTERIKICSLFRSLTILGAVLFVITGSAHAHVDASIIPALLESKWAAVNGPRKESLKDITIGENGLVPRTLDVDASGNIYVGGGREIWVYDKSGARTSVWQFDAAGIVRVSHEGSLVVGRTWEPTSQMRVLDKDGALLRTFGENKWLRGDAVGFDVPWDAAIDADGNVWSVNTHNLKETEARKVPNNLWGGLADDPNGGRIMFFDLKNDAKGEPPVYFGTFSNTPPEAGGPADALHQPSRIAFDPVHKKILVLDDWGVTRWNWPDGKFEARIVRQNADRGGSLLAVTPSGTLDVKLGDALEEIDGQGQKVRDLPKIDVYGASDLRVTADGSLYLCYLNAGIAFKKFSPSGELVLCRGLNVIKLRLAVPDADFTAGQRIPAEAVITNREQLYEQTIPGLAEIKRSLWIRPYDVSSEWRRLPVETESDGDDLTIPLDLKGACQLVLSASEAAPELLDSTAASVSVNVAIKSAAAKNGSITVATDRNEDAFVAGQWVRANVIGRSLAGVMNETVQVRFVDAKGKRLVEKSMTWTISKGGSVNLPFDLSLSSKLPVGDYDVMAVSPSLGTNATRIHVGEARENGRFSLFTALSLGQNTSHKTVQGIIRVAAKDGFSHDVTRYISASAVCGSFESDLSINRSMRQTLAIDPLLPAPETAELPNRIRLALNEMSSDGIHLWPETMGWETDTLNRTDAQKIMDKENLARWTQMGISSPAQDGFLWNETNWWGVDESRFKVQWADATRQSVSTMDGMPNGGQIQESDPLLSGDKLSTYLSYTRYAAEHLYPDNYNLWREYVRQMRADAFSAGVPAFYWHNWPEWTSRPLDGIMSYHQVEQICEPYMQLNDGAMMIHEGKPFWAGLETYPESGTGEFMARQLLPSLIWGAEGFWVNDMAGWQASLGNQEVLQAAHDLKAVLDPIGRRLRDTKYFPALGIYYPQAARVQGGNPSFRGPMYVKRVKWALLASFHAHIPAKVVFDEDLKAGRFDHLQYLLLPGLQSEIPTEDLASLDRFKALGGIILVGKNSDKRYAALGPPLDVDFDVDKDNDYVQSWASDVVIEKRQNVIGLAAAMQRALAPYLAAPVTIDDPEIWYALREGIDRGKHPVTYLIAVNQNYPDTLKPWQLWKMTTDYDSVIPVIRSAAIPSQFRYGYDLLHGEAIKIDDGKITLDFRRFPAAVIALSPRPLSAADLQEVELSSPSTPVPLSMVAAPDVDVFFGGDIQKALKSGRQIFVLSENEAARNKVVANLIQSGIPAQASTQPGDGINIAVSHPGDAFSLDDKDVLPVRLTENVPGAGRAILAYTRCFLPKATDAIVMAVADDDGLAKAVKKLREIKSEPNAPGEKRLVAPIIQEATPASMTEDTTKIWGARLATIRAAGGTIAVGAEEWGNNLFLLDATDGKLRSASKAGRFYTKKLWMSDRGDKIGAEAIFPEDINGYLEMFDLAGKSVARFARDGINTHNNWAYSDHTVRCDIFSFALSPDGSVVYSGSNLGLSALKTDGTQLWRHDYSGMDTGLDLLRNLWASRIALTPDGKYLAEAITHELPVASEFRGTSIIRKVEAATGKVVWEKTLDPIKDPTISEVSISPDGSTVTVIGHGGLIFLKDGQVICNRADAGQLHYSHLNWSADSSALYAVIDSRNSQTYPGIGQGVSEAQNAVMAYFANGTPQWQHGEAVPVVDLAADPQGGVVLSNGLCEIKRLANDGTVQWTATTDAVAHICSQADAVYSCDWHGNVYRLALTSGLIAWKKNVTESVWRSDIKKLLTEPYAGPTFGAQQRAAAEEPLIGDNVALQATVRVQGEGGWFKSAQVHIDPRDLSDGKTDNLTQPWLDIVDQEKADNWSKFVSVEYEWKEAINLQGLAIHEDSRHPESWPYHVCVEAFENGEWHDLAVRLMNPGPWHNIVLSQPKKVTRMRYTPTSIQANNLWTDEVRVIAARSP